MSASEDVPGDREERAFVVPERWEDPDERRRPALGEELGLAREARSLWGLPVDDRSLLQAVRDARAAEFHDGMYWTREETQDSEALEGLPSRIAPVLEPFHEILAGEQWSWEGDRRVFVVGVAGDPTALAEALRGVAGTARVRLVERAMPEAELERLGEAVWDAEEAIQAAGMDLQEGCAEPDDGVYEVTVAGPDERAGRQWLHARFGERLRVEWSGAGRHEPQPRAFASWVADGRTLTVHSWHDHNGERPGTCVATEHADRVEVHHHVLAPTGARTMVGGWVAIRARVELDAPVGARRVVDLFDGADRPSWPELRDTPLPDAEPDPADDLAARLRALPRWGAAIVADVEEGCGHPVADPMVARLRGRLRDPDVRALAAALLQDGHPDVRRAVRVGLIEDTLLLGPAADAEALRAAGEPVLRAEVAAFDALLDGLAPDDGEERTAKERRSPS